jgi:glutamate racemase
VYERQISEAVEKARKTGCTGLALEKHIARLLGCETMTAVQLDLMRPDFEALVWPITRAASEPAKKKSKAAQPPSMFKA